MRSIILFFLIGLVGLGAILLVRTPFLAPTQIDIEPVTDITIDAQAIANHLQNLIRFQTISYQDSEENNLKTFEALHAYLAQTFPKTHKILEKETVGGHSLVFTWTGSDTSLPPILLLAHLDVVPVEEGTTHLWHQPPFSGNIAEGFIWGRGTMDDKARVTGMLEAVEMLLEEGFSPQRTLMFAFGHDEEIGGRQGAEKIAGLLRARGLEFECIFDEGGAIITQGLLPNLSVPIALVGIAEKGYLTLELRVRTEGGHSSMPPSDTAISILSSAIFHLESQPFPSRLDGATRAMMEHLAPVMPIGKRIVLNNLWLFGSLVKNKLSFKPVTNAMVRTTLATTMLKGGVKENILPSEASAVLNLRVLPGDTIASTIDQVGRIIGDPKVVITQLGQPSEASAVSSTESWGFKMFERTLRQTFDGVKVSPVLVPATTDSRHYGSLSRHTYRLSPLMITLEDLSRIHGSNERISIENYVLLIKFYYQLFRNTDLNTT
jgi:carboxypeptidase PM20D1